MITLVSPIPPAARRRSTGPSFRNRRGLAVLAGLLLLSQAACTSIPKSDMPEARLGQLACPDLANEVAKAEETSRVAKEEKSNSWKFIFPGLIAARYAFLSWELTAAENRKAKLEDEQTSKNCIPG